MFRLLTLTALVPLTFALPLAAEDGQPVGPQPSVTLRRVVSKPVITIPDQNHPLGPLLRRAAHAYEAMQLGVRDYTCTIAKRERVDGRLRAMEFVQAKIRHEQKKNGQLVAPFGVYLRFLQPRKVEGREVLFVRGRNQGKMLVKRGGQRLASLTTSLDPRGNLAMREARYPVTEIGIKRLVAKLIDVLQEEIQYPECEVKYYRNAKINGRSCTRVRVIHPLRRSHFRYHMAEVFIDDERQIPLRFVSYDWPQAAGGKPRLLEEYTYFNLKTNVGLRDTDFERRNPDYGFKK